MMLVDDVGWSCHVKELLVVAKVLRAWWPGDFPIKATQCWNGVCKGNPVGVYKCNHLIITVPLSA